MSIAWKHAPGWGNSGASRYKPVMGSAWVASCSAYIRLQLQDSPLPGCCTITGFLCRTPGDTKGLAGPRGAKRLRGVNLRCNYTRQPRGSLNANAGGSAKADIGTTLHASSILLFFSSMGRGKFSLDSKGFAP